MDSLQTSNKTQMDIQNAAYRQIARKGLFSCTFVEIADSADISRQTLYNNYATMEILCSNLQNNILDKVLKMAIKGMESNSSPSEQIIGFFKSLYRILEKDEEMLKYLIKFDHYLTRHPDFLPGKFMFKNRLLSESPLMHLVAQSITDPHMTEKMSRILIESFLSYLERITFRRSAFIAESPIRFEDFHYYLDSVKRLLDNKKAEMS